MRLVLTGPKSLEPRYDGNYGSVPEDEDLLRVLYCGVCGTDARMWARGHRALALPRVPGHEIVVADRQDRRYVVWPGDSCGACQYCLTGCENLCRQIRIIGFHRDGGFADRILVPKTSLIPVPEELESLVACLAEPIGCVLRGLKVCRLDNHSRVLIVGGGTMGLLAALAAKDIGADPLIVEKNPAKIVTAGAFLDDTGIRCVGETGESDFDAVITACPDTDAFSRGLTSLAKGGSFCFFSGLAENKAMATSLINLIHYREITITGVYGLNREDMRRALSFMAVRQSILKRLITGIVDPEEAPALMATVLSGSGFKYILGFSGA